MTLRLGGSKNIQFTSGSQKGVKQLVAWSRWIGGSRILVRPLLSPKANRQTVHIRAHEHALQRLCSQICKLMSKTSVHFHRAHTCTCTSAQDTCLVHATPTVQSVQFLQSVQSSFPFIFKVTGFYRPALPQSKLSQSHPAVCVRR